MKFTYLTWAVVLVVVAANGSDTDKNAEVLDTTAKVAESVFTTVDGGIAQAKDLLHNQAEFATETLKSNKAKAAEMAEYTEGLASSHEPRKLAHQFKENVIHATVKGLDAAKEFVDGAAGAMKDQVEFVTSSAKHGFEAAKGVLIDTGNELEKQANTHKHAAEGQWDEVKQQVNYEAEIARNTVEDASHKIHEHTRRTSDAVTDELNHIVDAGKDGLETISHVAHDIAEGVKHEFEHFVEATHEAIDYTEENAPLDMDSLRAPDKVSAVDQAIEHVRILTEKAKTHAKRIGDMVKEYFVTISSQKKQADL